MECFIVFGFSIGSLNESLTNLHLVTFIWVTFVIKAYLKHIREKFDVVKIVLIECMFKLGHQFWRWPYFYQEDKAIAKDREILK